MTDAETIPAGSRAAILEMVPVLFGLAVLFMPTFYKLFSGMWMSEEQAHGPIVFVLALWLMYRQRKDIVAGDSGWFSTVSGWILFLVGLGCYVVGRSQDLMLLELGALIWILAGILLVKCGVGVLGRVWFPLFFMLFMLPLPGSLVIMLTMPMKMAVSYVTESLLFWMGYPVARNGVVLQIGQYQLLVADACAGLQTFLTLESLGLFYLNIVQHSSVFRNVALAILIVPISFFANVIRVVMLTLITYYWGDEVGQGFLHGFAGMVLFVSALVLITGLDRLLQYFIAWRSNQATQAIG